MAFPGCNSRVCCKYTDSSLVLQLYELRFAGNRVYNKNGIPNELYFLALDFSCNYLVIIESLVSKGF